MIQGLQVWWHCLRHTFQREAPYHRMGTWATCDANFVLASGHFCTGCGYHGWGPQPPDQPLGFHRGQP